MKGEKELVMDEGSDGREGKETEQKTYICRSEFFVVRLDSLELHVFSCIHITFLSPHPQTTNVKDQKDC